MTRRPVPLVLIAVLALISTVTFAQRSSSPPSSSSSSSGGGHASSASSSSPSTPSYSSSHSSGPSFSGASQPSHSNAGSNAPSHSGGWSHSNGNAGAGGRAHSNPNPGGSMGRGDRNPSTNHATPRFNQGDASRSNNQPHRPGSQVNATPRAFEPAPTKRGNANHHDSERAERLRTPNITRPQPGVHDTTTRHPDAEHRSRMSRIFLFWKHPQKNPDATSLARRVNPEIKRPNPCKGAGCKPVCLPGQAMENGACAGTPTRPQPPQQQVRCPDGSTQANGVCPAYTTAYARSSACDGLSGELDLLQRQLEQLYEARNRECGRDPNGVACYSLTNQIATLEQRLQQLRQQHSACVSSHP